MKTNQAGTITRTAEVIERAREAGISTVVSARSGETCDSPMADLAVAYGVGQLKVGSLACSERLAECNVYSRSHPNGLRRSSSVDVSSRSTVNVLRRRIDSPNVMSPAMLSVNSVISINCVVGSVSWPYSSFLITSWSTSVLSTPTAFASCSKNSTAFSRETPPLGTSGICSSGSYIALTCDGSSLDTGNNLHRSAPLSIAVSASVGAITPGITGVPYRFPVRIMSVDTVGVARISSAPPRPACGC